MKAEETLKKYLGHYPDEHQKPVWNEIIKAMEEHAESQLQALKEEVEKLKLDGQHTDWDWDDAMSTVLNLITNLEDK